MGDEDYGLTLSLGLAHLVPALFLEAFVTGIAKENTQASTYKLAIYEERRYRRVTYRDRTALTKEF
jgi:hypothetical protein